jgi:hypothetical protein
MSLSIASANLATTYSTISTSPTVTSYAGTPSSITNGWLNTNTGTTTLKVAGDAEFDGDVKIKGVNLTSRLDAIEERLGILRPNNDLEGKWEKLKALGEEYRALEKDILEKEKIWDLLRK